MADLSDLWTDDQKADISASVEGRLQGFLRRLLRVPALHDRALHGHQQDRV